MIGLIVVTTITKTVWPTGIVALGISFATDTASRVSALLAAIVAALTQSHPIIEIPIRTDTGAVAERSMAGPITATTVATDPNTTGTTIMACHAILRSTIIVVESHTFAESGGIGGLAMLGGGAVGALRIVTTSCTRIVAGNAVEGRTMLIVLVNAVTVGSDGVDGSIGEATLTSQPIITSQAGIMTLRTKLIEAVIVVAIQALTQLTACVQSSKSS